MIPKPTEFIGRHLKEASRRAQSIKRQTMLDRYGTFGVHQSTIKMFVSPWETDARTGIRTRIIRQVEN